MTNSKSTKKALLSSVLALVLCFSMLLGTTFAWFTDSVTSEGNIIKSGTLEVLMDWADGKADPAADTTEWKDASKEAIFNYNLWEPGYVDVKHIRVTNDGTLALKYQMMIEANGEVSDLAKVIDVYFIDGGKQIAARTDLDGLTPVGTLDQVIDNFMNLTYGELTAGTSEIVTIALKMQETAGNDYQDKSIGSDFSVKLLATQLASETDSFDETYDENAVYTDVIVDNAADLHTAVEAATGSTVIGISGEIALTKNLVNSLNTKRSTARLNSITFIGVTDDAALDSATYQIQIYGATVTFKNLTLTHNKGGLGYGDGGYARTNFSVWNASAVNYVDCVFEGGVATLHAATHNFTGCTFNQDDANVYNLYHYDGAVVNVDDCTFNTSERCVLIYSEQNGDHEYVNISNCTFLGTAAEKAAIEIDSRFCEYTVTVTDCIVSSDIVSGIYRDKYPDTGKTHITLDGVSTAKQATVTNATELKDVLTEAGLAGAGNTVITFSGDDIDMTDATWTPIEVDGYNGADIVTIDGNGATITGLTAPLFAGGFAGGSGIVIKNLTIADSDIVSTNTIGSGAFIESVDSMDVITLDNCHLLNSTVTGGDGSRTGGLIGWTAGYNNENNGPVKTYVTIKNCSVIGNTITCNGSVGGIYGHAGNNAWTYSVIENCTVKDNVLSSTDDGGWKVGVVVGTANVGEVTISNITESGNTLTQTGKTAPEGQSNLYGRFVPGETGKLVIDGEEITA